MVYVLHGIVCRACVFNRGMCSVLNGSYDRPCLSSMAASAGGQGIFMFISQDGKVEEQKWDVFREKVLKKYYKGKASSVKYDEVVNNQVVMSGSICVEEGCNCQGDW